MLQRAGLQRRDGEWSWLVCCLKYARRVVDVAPIYPRTSHRQHQHLLPTLFMTWCANVRLYRSILLLHKQKLPSNMRNLGDSYVREEFKRHQDANAENVKLFVTEWSKYREMLQGQSSSFGTPIDGGVVSAMSDEQKEQLEKLKHEVHREAGGV